MGIEIKPFILLKNRVWRTYSGGKCIEEWQKLDEPIDSSFPEEWVASTVIAANSGREHIVEGLSQVLLEEDQHISLKELIRLYPEQMLGKAHITEYGLETAVLVKVLDAAERLTLQVHPDREFARTAFQSRFGKTEAWYILGGREIAGESPYVLLGFKPGMTKERWKELVEQQDIPTMLDSLHKVPVQSGDVFLVEGGIPHAIGSGCFLIEIQEPTDYTLRVEKTTPNGLSLPDKACHQGLGYELMLEGFHYTSFNYDETLNQWKKKPRISRSSEEGNEFQLISSTDTDRFRMNLLEVTGRMDHCQYGAFTIAIVISGYGKLLWREGALDITQSDHFFIPSALDELYWENTGNEPLSVIVCYPPQRAL